MLCKSWVFAAFGVALSYGALAQTTTPPTGTIPEKVAPGADLPNTDLSKKNGTLSDKLNDTNGVIHPQGAVDPSMQKPAPAIGATPIIKPQGDAGEAQPK
jgi:hypothetical protein